jgi:hypothetical protein
VLSFFPLNGPTTISDTKSKLVFLSPFPFKTSAIELVVS